MSLSGSLLRILMKMSTRKLSRQWRDSLVSPEAAQAGRLAEILFRHRQSEYGRKYDFKNNLTPAAFRQTVPIVSYEDLRKSFVRMQNSEGGVLVDEPIEMFAVTSGTMGKPKFIPITRSMNLEQHRSHRLWMKALVRDHPGATEGALLTMVSPAIQGYTPGGIPYGSASGKGYLNQPFPVRRLHAVPYEAICIADYEAKYYCLLAFALARKLSCVTSVNPSTLYLYGELMQRWSEPLLDDLAASAAGAGCLNNCPNLTPEELRPLERLLLPERQRVRELREIMKRDGCLLPRNAWPELEAICTWHGGNAPFYLAKLPEFWGEAPARCLGLRASEGMFSIPLADATPEGVLATWGHFMEFIPSDLEPERNTAKTQTLLAHELELGKRYRMVITTSGGLYRYDLGDVVEVTEFLKATPLIAFLHKAGKVLSITGEKITEEQVVAAMRGVEKDFPDAIEGFTVTLRLGEPPRYLLAVEPRREGLAQNKEFLARLAKSFDQHLGSKNIEYEEKRKSARLGLPDTLPLQPGSYSHWRRDLVAQGRPDGQLKPPHLVLTEAELQRIREAGALHNGPRLDSVRQ